MTLKKDTAGQIQGMGYRSKRRIPQLVCMCKAFGYAKNKADNLEPLSLQMLDSALCSHLCSFGGAHMEFRMEWNQIFTIKGSFLIDIRICRYENNSPILMLLIRQQH